MRQGKGTELLGSNDPRGDEIGIIYVGQEDERKDVLTALLTQAKLDAKQIVIALPPEQVKAFQRLQDFDALKAAIKEKKIRSEIIFIAPGGTIYANFARQRRFTVYSSLESFANALRDRQSGDQPGKGRREEKKGGLFGRKPTGAGGAPAPGAAAGAAGGSLAGRDEPALPPQPQIPPSQHQPERTPLRSLYVDRPTVDINEPGKPGDESSTPATSQTGARAEQNQQSDQPSEPESSTAPAAKPGAAGGLLAAEMLRPRAEGAGASESLDDDYALEPTRSPASGISAPAPSIPASPPNTPGVAGTSKQPTNDLSVAPAQETKRRSMPLNTPAPGVAAAGAIAEVAAAGEQNIIELGPRRKQKPRSTRKLPDNSPEVGTSGEAASVERAEALEPASAPPKSVTRPPTPTRRKTDKTAAIAGAAVAGAAVGAASSSRTVASGGVPGTVTRSTGISRPPARTPYTRPGTGGSSTGGGPGGTRRRGRWPLWLILLVLLLLIVLSGGLVTAAAQPQFLSSVFGGNTNSATVTIMPDSKIEPHSYIITAITKNPNVDKREVLLDEITSAPAPKKGTVTATGKGTIPAKAATGSIVFRNSSFVAVTIAPTTFNANGITFKTTETVTVAAGTKNANGNIVPSTIRANAQANTAGTVGNIPAGAIDVLPCCGSDSVEALNDAAFTEGQDAQTYAFLQQSDIDNFATEAKNELKQAAANGIAPKVKANEQLVQTNCDNPTVDSTANAGDRVNSATVTVSATCTGLAYDRTGPQGAQSIVKKALQSQLALDAGNLSDHYVLAGDIVMQTGLLSVDTDKLSLSLQARGIWYYTFSDQQQKELANKIAGKPTAQAAKLLTQAPGIKGVNIKIDGGGNTLPTDPSKIKLVFTSVAGAKSTDLPTPNATLIPPPGARPGGTTGTPQPLPTVLGK